MRNIFLPSKKGLSTIIATVILIALTLVAVGIIWGAVAGLVRDQTDQASTCFNLLEKVTLEDRYTCYNQSSNEVHFSINIGDIDIEEVLVGVSTNDSGKIFSIFKEGSEIENLRMFGDDDGSDPILLPGKESGNTYIFELTDAGLEGFPASVQIIPVIEGKQCEVTDAVRNFGPC